ncbi:tetratricopeptide repeat protein [Flavobacterium sp. U410]
MATYNKRGYKAPKPKEVEENVENEFEEVVETGDSTTAEVFNTLDETANKAEDWVAKNQKVILGVVGAIAVVTLGYFFYNKFMVEPKEEKALNDIYLAQSYFNDALNNTQAADSLFTLALNGAEGKLGFVGVAEEYSGTKTGNLANYYAGMSYLHLKDFQKAETSLLKFKSDDMFLQAAAYGALGDAYSELNKVEDAISYYKKAAEANENDYTTPRFLNKAAQLALLNNKKEEAHGLFVKIKENYENSREAMNIDMYIAMTE